MCGLCGVVSTSFGTLEYDIFQKLLFLNVFRGEDSTGVVRIEQNGSAKLRKTLLSSPEFIKSKEADIIKPATNEKSPFGFLGHTRHATKGSVILKNAHPFRFPNLIGMHNGTIHAPFKHKKEYDTDSEALYHNISEDGLEAALNEVEAYDTAYALQWYDTEKQTINFIKNDKRPLHFTFLYGGMTMIWSSEIETLRLLLKHKKYTSNLGFDGDTKSRIFTLSDYDHMCVQLKGKPMETAEITSIPVKKKSYQTPFQTTTTGGTPSGWTGQTTNGSTEGKTWVEISPNVWRLANAPEVSLRDVVDKQTGQTQNAGKSSKESQKNLGTTTGGTSGATGKKSNASDSTESRSLEDNYRSFRDEHGQNIKTLPWLEERAPWDGPSDKGGEGSDPFLADLFDTNFEDANNQAEGGAEVIDIRTRKNPEDGYTINLANSNLRIPESEFRYRLTEGCLSCGQVFSMDNPHDIWNINHLHWHDRLVYACDDCYSESEGDWVRCLLDEWPEELVLQEENK